MTRTKIPFSKPFFTGESLKEINAKIEEILQTGWLTSGAIVEEFEKMFADFVGTKYAVALNSCTAALHTILLGLGVKNGDEVIVPSDTFVATANSVLYVGAKPVFADSDLETFNISPEDIQRKISKKTKAILLVHLAGNPCDMEEIWRLAEDNKLLLIEDSAHAHGAKYKGKNCGMLGEAAAFSFYPTKIITTAEGGMVTTDSEALAEKVKIIRNHGRAAYGPSQIIELGFNYRLSEIHAAIGLNQIRHIHDFIEQRNMLASVYSQRLTRIPWLKPQRIDDGNECSYYAYIVRLTGQAPMSRDALADHLKKNGIATSILYHPVHLQPFYVRQLGCREGDLPVAEELGKNSLALPLYNGMRIEDAIRVVETIEDAEKT